MTAQRDSLFLRICDKVSFGIGTPTNIVTWLGLVMVWFVIFAAHLVPSNASFMPSWFTGTAFNFPLNTVTTLAELYIGFLVAAATNRAERALMQVIDGIRLTVQHVLDGEQRMTELLEANTALTQQVHDLTAQVHQLVSGTSA